MKKLLFLITIICGLNASAQSYLISFVGTGETTTVTSVIVENLTEGSTLILNGDDILRLTSTVGISETVNNLSPGIILYPNPMTDKSTLLISSPVAGEAIISIYDLSGRQLTQIKSNVENFTQKFTLSGLERGTYIVNVKGNNYQFSGKLLNSGGSKGLTTIQKTGDIITDETKTLKTESKGVRSIRDMEYSSGDILNKTIIFNFIACSDGDGNTYPVIEITSDKKGSQVWMAVNLKTTKYSNGELIGTTNPATLDISCQTNPKYQWAYDGNESNSDTYGRLYTWYTVTDSRNVCPDGWHVPTDADWTGLITALGGEYAAMIKMKETGETHWLPGTSVPTATNKSGYTALPAGYRNEKYGFMGIRTTCSWWSANEFNSTTAWYRSIDFLTDYVIRDNMAYTKKTGLSVRCTKN